MLPHRDEVPRVTLCAIALLLVAAAVPAAGKQVKPAAVFVLGDSYSDTGNRNKSDPLTNQDWKHPYGLTWGGGRFSDGRVSTDYLVELFGLPPIATFASINDLTPARTLRHGVNFAVGGAGVFPVRAGFPTIYQQVDQLRQIIGKHPNLYFPGQSVVLVTCTGNDYTQFGIDHPGATVEEYHSFSRSIVGALSENLQNLYAQGFRNFGVFNVPTFQCFPDDTKQNATSCNPDAGVLDTYHNAQLLAGIQKLQADLPQAHFVQLDLFKAFTYVIRNPQFFGLTHPLGACCAPQPNHYCGDFDAQGNPLFSLCPDPQHYLFWDTLHPTDAGWKALVNLFYSGFNITTVGGPNLLVWLNTLNLSGNELGSKGPEIFDKAALGVVQFLASQYPHLYPFLSSTGALEYLPTALSKVGPVTVFIPNEESIEKQVGAPVVEAVQNYTSVATQVALVQVVYGWWPADRLARIENGHTLRSLEGAKVRVFKEGSSIFLTTGDDGSVNKVRIVQPAWFAAKGVVLVHQTDSFLPS